MIFSKTEDLEDRVVDLALKERASIRFIHEHLNRERRVSLRAVYKAVDKLVHAEVLIKAGKRVMVDEEWVQRVADRVHTSLPVIPSVGERITNTFISLAHLDAFWKTTVLPIEIQTDEREVFFYNPHNFWAYMPDRRESEDAYYRHFTEQKRHGFFTVGGDSLMDMEFKREYQSEYLQIDTRDIPSLRRSDHLTLIGPLVITVRLSKRTALRIDEIYKSGKGVKDTLSDLLAVYGSPGKTKVIVENNPLKARKLKALLAKNFYFRFE